MKNIARSTSSRALVEANLLGGKADWKLLYYCLKITHPDETFGEPDSNFDFKTFYESFENLDEEKMLMEVENLLIRLQK